MFGIRLDPASYMSITAQLCQQVRQNIENGEFGEGLRLPPTRKLAAEFGIARNVVIDAYEQLIAEGYLIGQAGSGTYVAGGIQQSPAGAANEKQLDVEGLTEDSTPRFLKVSSISRSERRIYASFPGSFGRNI